MQRELSMLRRQSSGLIGERESKEENAYFGRRFVRLRDTFNVRDVFVETQRLERFNDVFGAYRLFGLFFAYIVCFG